MFAFMVRHTCFGLKDDILISKEKKYRNVRLLIAALMLLLSSILWVIPSDVIKLVVRQKHVMLGRYSLEKFSLLLFISPLLWFVVAFLCSKAKFDKNMVFRIITVTFSSLITLTAAMILSTIFFSPRYIEEAIKETTASEEAVEVTSMHRAPNEIHIVEFKDEPTIKYSSLDVPLDSHLIEFTFKTDDYGFRNQSNLKQYDIVAVGDSFVEGSKVLDGECWTTVIKEKLNRSVYNLGISGASPGVYLNNFFAVGKNFNPDIAIFMIYEGNDFKNKKYNRKGVKFGNERISFFKKYIKKSPIVSRIRQILLKYFQTKQVQVKHFETKKENTVVPDDDPLSWIPIVIKAGGKTNYYSFKPKRLVRLYRTEKEFLGSPEWTVNAEIFRRIKHLTEQEKVRLIFVYAPSKPHFVGYTRQPYLRSKLQYDEYPQQYHLQK